MTTRLPSSRGQPTRRGRGPYGYRSAHDRGAVRRPDRGFGLVPPHRTRGRAGGAPRRRGPRRARCRRGRRRPGHVGGRIRRVRGRAGPRPRDAGTGTGPAATRSSGCPWRGSRCSRTASAPHCPSRRRAPRRRIGRRVASFDRSRLLRRRDRTHPRAHRGRRHLPGQPHPAAPLAGRKATSGASTETSATRSEARTPRTSTSGATGCSPPRPSCSSGSTTAASRRGR